MGQDTGTNREFSHEMNRTKTASKYVTIGLLPSWYNHSVVVVLLKGRKLTGVVSSGHQGDVLSICGILFQRTGKFLDRQSLSFGRNQLCGSFGMQFHTVERSLSMFAFDE